MSEITLPPPDIRQIIEKTAGYVARNHGSFEQRVKSKEAANPKFAFLMDGDPYNAYYRDVLSKIKAGTLTETSAPVTIEQTSNELMAPPALEFLADQFKVNPVDLEAIKLAAQFVAVNGDGFTSELRRFAKKNHKLSIQLEFLDRKHSLHKVYKWYLSRYREILDHRDQLIERLESFDERRFLDRCYDRAEWDKKKQMDQSNKVEEEKRRRLEYASIDWQDFVVVETVQFTELDEVAELEAPLNRNELEYRSLIQKRAQSLIEEAAPDEVIEESTGRSIPVTAVRRARGQKAAKAARVSKAEETNSSSPVDKSPSAQRETAKIAGKRMNIRPANESRIKRRRQELRDKATGEKLLRCPLTDKLVPESKFAQHMSILLRDPRYKEEKERYEAKFTGSAQLSSAQIYENMVELMAEPKK